MYFSHSHSLGIIIFSILEMWKQRLRKATSPRFHSSSIVELGPICFSTSLQQMGGNFRKETWENQYLLHAYCMWWVVTGPLMIFLLLCGGYDCPSLRRFREIVTCLWLPSSFIVCSQVLKTGLSGSRTHIFFTATCCLPVEDLAALWCRILRDIAPTIKSIKFLV